MAHARAEVLHGARRAVARRSCVDRRLEAGRRSQGDGGLAPDRLQVVAAIRPRGRRRTRRPPLLPHGTARTRFGSKEVAAIVRAPASESLKGPHRLAYDLGRHRSTIYGVLRRHGVSRLAAHQIGRLARSCRLAYERDYWASSFHVDVKKLGRIRDGGGWRMRGKEGSRDNVNADRVGFDYLHVAIDDHSRVAFV